ncbi:MAG: aminotransferase class V-fold PLP-dependent enzyme [Bauldia sp.]|uniref:aminotransferase class V-fold PLP-dependent enzyme n=1 Tax=Bauldia sp. TaxID=2575872 RepID=UPI001D1F2BC4|nr:aminotransferase class V-fold PLP-dependent enzyme [Bauldia sp.]MCB1495248.1 aminotransferase class V-fold PLP-dependent enzyme [Bauldia sp.]
MTVYARRGIPTIINAAGTLTRLSGGVIRPEVAQAMAEASALAVDMAVLQAHASGVIAGLTGAKAGYVTSGAAAGLLIGTAACVTGLGAAAMARLPDASGLRNQVVISRSQRNGYDHAVRTTGVTLVEVGLPDRASGAGIRDAEPWEYAAAINDNTAAVHYVATRDSLPSLAEVAAVAHAAGVPVIVDAAAELPPQANLKRFIAEGADLVAFSGGKAIGGPQASGILCGRRDLIAAAALQQLDMDVVTELWDPPARLIDRSALDGLPRHGIGRPCKAGKEEIIGLLTALELFVAEGDEARHERWLADITIIAEGLAAIASADTVITGGDDTGSVPKAELRFPRGSESQALAFLRALLADDPAIHAEAGDHRAGVVRFNPVALRAGQATVVAEAARAFAAGARR